MIDTAQKEAIKNVLGKHYTLKVVFYLEKRKIYNSDGNTFSSASIQKIVSGKQENPVVEMAIAKLVSLVRRQNLKDHKIKNNLLN